MIQPTSGCHVLDLTLTGYAIRSDRTTSVTRSSSANAAIVDARFAVATATPTASGRGHYLGGPWPRRATCEGAFDVEPHEVNSMVRHLVAIAAHQNIILISERPRP
jgi:hypothetical protein